MSQPDRIYIPQEVLETCQLPAETKKFLHESGLPFQLGPNPNEPWTVFRDSDFMESFKYHKKNYYILGDDEFDGKTCVRENTGEVFVIAEMDDVNVRFLNSSVQKMVLFSDWWRSRVNPGKGRKNRAEARTSFEALRSKMQQADPKALADAETCWSIVLDDVGYELEE